MSTKELLDSDVDVSISGSNPLGRLVIANAIEKGLSTAGFKNVESVREPGTEDQSILDVVVSKNPEIFDVGINVIPLAAIDAAEDEDAEDDSVDE